MARTRLFPARRIISADPLGFTSLGLKATRPAKWGLVHFFFRSKLLSRMSLLVVLIFSTASMRTVSLPLLRGISGIMYLFVRGFSRVMYLYQAPDEFSLGEKLDYKLVLRNPAPGRGEGVYFMSHRGGSPSWTYPSLQFD